RSYRKLSYVEVMLFWIKDYLFLQNWAILSMKLFKNISRKLQVLILWLRWKKTLFKLKKEMLNGLKSSMTFIKMSDHVLKKRKKKWNPLKLKMNRQGLIVKSVVIRWL